MSYFMRFLDCVLLRRHSSRDKAEGEHDEQRTAHRRSPSHRYHSELPPTIGNQARATGPPSRGIALDNPDRGPVSIVPEGHARFNSRAMDQTARRQRSSFHEEIFESEMPRPAIARSRDPTPLTDGNDVHRVTGDGSDTDDNNINCGFNFRLRGDSRAENKRFCIQPCESSSAPTKTTRKLNKRDEGVIRALFSRDKFRPAPKEVSWDDFEKTMTYLGFSVTSVKGSPHHLRMAEANELFPAGSAEKKVTVHRPHKPNQKSTFTRNEMREIGKQLTLKYGWTEETFLPYL
ncbi:hypothetical protein F5X97DRAFT_342644 [Nemania serpens]|nr:hypothetical protein F5X97DRAFT_342644 [Nemania serpens]